MPRRRLIVATAAATLTSWVGARSREPAAGGGSLAEPLLATVYTGQVDPALCLVSEKYDGVRAVWDGRVLRHRSGREVAAPRSFLAALPAEPLDGELWLGRGRFEALSAIVRTAMPRDADWARVRYMVFEQPAGAGSFAARAARLAELAKNAGAAQLVAAPQERVADRAALQRRLESVTAAGGEGLMLHLASAPVAGGRSDTLMKLKPHLDAEAVVVGVRPGTGKYRGQVGALEVENAEGRRFWVGSGLTDALRSEPPPTGSLITYRYRELTSTGLPRFATYLRRHEAL
ncbi:MAG: DNA ligase [Burkholderiales bacterium]|nr:DNA ligase [Burkholderiales bacterium]